MLPISQHNKYGSNMRCRQQQVMMTSGIKNGLLKHSQAKAIVSSIRTHRNDGILRPGSWIDPVRMLMP